MRLCWRHDRSCNGKRTFILTDQPWLVPFLAAGKLRDPSAHHTTLF